jgi:hypothetical protein
MGLVTSVAPHSVTEVTMTSSLGLVLSTPFGVAYGYRNLAGWGLGLSHPGSVFLWSTEPEAPYPTPPEELPIWSYDDEVLATVPAGGDEYVDMSYDDTLVPVGGPAQGELVAMGFNDAVAPVASKGETVEIDFNDEVLNTLQKGKP